MSNLYLRYLSDSTSRLYVSNTHLCIYILELGFHNWKTECVLRDMDLDDKAQNIVRLVDDNTLAKTDAKNQIRVMFLFILLYSNWTLIYDISSYIIKQISSFLSFQKNRYYLLFPFYIFVDLKSNHFGKSFAYETYLQGSNVNFCKGSNLSLT